MSLHHRIENHHFVSDSSSGGHSPSGGGPSGPSGGRRLLRLLKTKTPFILKKFKIPLFLLFSVLTFFLGRMSALTPRTSISLADFNRGDSTTRTSTTTHATHAYDKWAIALKSGRDVALKRTPIQLMTFLAPVRDRMVIIGDAAGVFVADVEMVDVVTAGQRNENSGYVSVPKMIRDATEGRQLVKRTVAEVVPDETSKGWKSDAQKNIPGFRVLYEKFPDAEWYIMIDDDTYVLMDNLKEALDNLDPMVPHYLGAVTGFIGCDGVRSWSNTAVFAHGGSGIVVSRGALLKMLPIVDTCIEKYKSCWAGDIRLGLCLRDVGVPVKNAGFFSSDPPNSKFNFTYPCSTPRTFHHLLPDQMQKLYELEQVAKRQHQRVLLVDVFRAFLDDTAMVNYDRPGGDFKNAKTASAEECKALCKSLKKCVAYTFETGGCQLKSSAPPIKKRNTGAVTGLVPEHFVCLDRNKW